MNTFNLYNYSGKLLKSIKYTIENDVLIVKNSNGIVKRKIKADREFTYKFTKTLVKAIDGTEGLVKFIKEANQPNGLYNSMFYYTLEKLS